MSVAEPAIGCQSSPFMLVSINVPLEPPDQQYCQAAVGYVELGMFQDANDQLEKIDPFNRAAPEVFSGQARHLSWTEEMGVDAANRQTSQTTVE